MVYNNCIYVFDIQKKNNNVLSSDLVYRYMQWTGKCRCEFHAHRQ